MSSASRFAVKAGNDGFAENTPPDWKPILRNATPNPALVEKYRQLCELGKAMVPIACFQPHPLQRATDSAHIARLAREIQQSNQHRDFPCLVVAQQEPQFHERWEDSPFVTGDGDPVDVWTLCGNHRVHALRLLMEGEEYETSGNEGWYSIVLHPCFLKIHPGHVERLIIRDNVDRAASHVLLPASDLVHLKYALGIYAAIHEDSNGASRTMMLEVEEQLAHLEIFKGGWSNNNPTKRWKVGLRVLMREPRAVVALFSLLSVSGTLQKISTADLGRFMVNLAQKGRGLEGALALFFNSAALTQKRLNWTYREAYPEGFILDQFWDDVGKEAFMENEGDDTLIEEPTDGTETIPTSEQHAAWERALHTGSWGPLIECFDSFALAFEGARVQDENGNSFPVGRAPNIHLACVSGDPSHEWTGGWIEMLSRIRAGVRMMCFMLFGPVGIRKYSDPALKDLLLTPKSYDEHRRHSIYERLGEWAMDNGVVPSSTPARERKDARKLIDKLIVEFMDREKGWAVPKEIWMDISVASQQFFGPGGEPDPKAKGDLSPALYPALARIANSVLGIPAWYDLLVCRWKLQPGDPFPWEESVLVTNLTAAEIEADMVKRHMVHMARAEGAKSEQEVNAARQKVQGLNKQMEALHGKRAEIEESAAPKIQGELQKLEKKKAQQIEAMEKKIQQLKDEPLKEVDGEIARANAKKERLEEKQKNAEAALEEIRAEVLTTERLVEILGKRGITINVQPLTGKIEPPARARSPPIPTQGTADDIVAKVESVFRHAAPLLPWNVRVYLAQIAEQCGRKGGEAREWSSAIVDGLGVEEGELKAPFPMFESDEESNGSRRRPRDDPNTPAGAAARKRQKGKAVTPTRKSKSMVDTDTDEDEALPGPKRLFNSERQSSPPPHHNDARAAGKVLVPSSSAPNHFLPGEEPSGQEPLVPTQPVTSLGSNL